MNPQMQAFQPQQQQPQPQGQPSTAPGSLGATTRPKPRFIDKVLMQNRDKKLQDAMQEMMASQSAEAAAIPQGSGTGSFLSNLFAAGRQ